MGAKKAKKGKPKNVLYFARVVGAMNWSRAYRELAPAVDEKCVYDGTKAETIRNVFFAEPLDQKDGPGAPRGYRARSQGVGASMSRFVGKDAFAGSDGDAWWVQHVSGLAYTPYGSKHQVRECGREGDIACC
jgi:hypothetical protein